MKNQPRFKLKNLKLNDNSQLIEIVDISKIDITNYNDAVLSINIKSGKIPTLEVDILVVGGGLGGCAAALSASQNYSKTNKPKIALIEETQLLGGQISSQGVSALDENYLVETSGANFSYQIFRQKIRDYYQQQTNLKTQFKSQKLLNPGNCWVSRLAFEPLVGVKVLNELLQPFCENNILFIKTRSKAIYTRLYNREIKFYSPSYVGHNHQGVKIKGIGFYDFENKQVFEIRAKQIIDSTERGDLLNICQIAYVSGCESQDYTQEPHAPLKADPDNTQDFTYPFILEFDKDNIQNLAKPQNFEKFLPNCKMLNYKVFQNNSFEGKNLLPFWEYRRLIDSKLFNDDKYRNDISMINWEANDLRGYNIIDQKPTQEAYNLALGKELSLSFAYWLQNMVPRDDYGLGYKEFKLRYDLLQSQDGLSIYPYIRESRRIVAKYTIKEQDISANYNTGPRAKLFSDSIGIGFYPIDIHGRKEISDLNSQSKPFQIPLGAIIPKYGANLLAGCKNIGTTHITNGSYRLHPIEWAIGEACGIVAMEQLKTHQSASAIYKCKKALLNIQKKLIARNIPLFWFDDIATDNKYFNYIQYLAIISIFDFSQSFDLSFKGNDKVEINFFAQSLLRSYAFSKNLDFDQLLSRHKLDKPIDIIKFLIKRKYLKKFNSNNLENNNLYIDYNLLDIIWKTKHNSLDLNRFEFAKWLYLMINRKRY